MPIRLLPPQLANQIAAGEVVERPASVVKELLENSIDAGASKIEIDIVAGGHKRILIRDNGKGIDKQELELALSRHATSKIECLDDLEAISSLGFRGEALASISSVSRLTLTSKTQKQSEAWQAQAEGREMSVKLQPAAHPTGTSIDVQDLFFNTPARKRFLRTEKTEFSHIESVFTRIALANHAIEFVLRHNGKRIKHLKSVDTLEPRITSLLSHLKADKLWQFRQQCDEVSIDGFIVEPTTEQSHQEVQYSFVNHRPMRDKLLNHAIKQAYEQAGLDDVKPQFVLFVSVAAEEVDVNVHPAKHEVRFHQARLVHDFIASSLRKLVVEQLSSQDSEWQAPQISELAPAHDYISQPRQHSTNQAVNSGSATPRARTHQTINPSMAAANYGQLMNDTSAASGAVDILRLDGELACIKHCELNDVFVVEWCVLERRRLMDELAMIQVSQPLLMPVAIPAVKLWSEALRQQFESLNFQIDKVASKLILKQVPAGWRAKPWSRVFEAMINPSDDLAAHIVGVISECNEHAIHAESTKQWFLSQQQQTQVELLKQLGKEIPTVAFLEFLKSFPCQK